jgi:tripartite-type tricarboxylate transporter receptor subunit TctC
MHAPGRVLSAILLVAAFAIFQHQHLAPAATRTVRIIVPSSVGGGADTLARLLADEISRAQTVTVIVENRPGASNTIGTEAVARAVPDGNTLLVATPELVINPHLRKLGYDPLLSFAPVCYLARSPQLLVVNDKSPYRTLKDLLDAARAKPGELALASAGPASGTHFAFETLKRRAEVNIAYVPYQGSAPAVNAVLAQHVAAALASYPNVVEQIKANTLRALAVASPARLKDMPDVPTVAESGFPNFESDIWFGVVVPANTPREVVTQLADWLIGALRVPDIAKRLEVLGLFPVGMCGADFDGFIRAQYDKYGLAIREAGFGTR